MKNRITNFATAGAVAALVATSAFAAPQFDNNGGRRNRDNRDQQTQQQPQTPRETQQQTDNGSRWNRNRDQQNQQLRQQPQNTQEQWNRGESRDRNADRREVRDNNAYRGEGNRGSYNYRENQRITTSGRISSFRRERDGYRVDLDRGRESYWIPESRLGGRGLRVGIDISLGGIFRGGIIDVDAINWPGAYGYGYDGGFVRGVIQRVDYRDGFATMRDDASGQFIRVNLRAASQELRPGDYVTLEGHWERGGLFDAVRIDDVR